MQMNSYYFEDDYCKASQGFYIQIIQTQFRTEQHTNEVINQLDNLKSDSKVLKLLFQHTLNFESEDINIGLFQSCFQRCNKINEIHLMLNLINVKNTSLKNLMNLLNESYPVIKKFSFYCKEAFLKKGLSDIIYSSLRNFKNLENVQIFNKVFTQSIPQSIGNNISQIESLVSLNLSLANVQLSGSINLFNDLSKLTNLLELSIKYAGNTISSPRACQALSNMISSFKFLRQLSLILCSTKLSQEGIIFIGQGLENCSKELKYLKIDISNNEFNFDWLYEFSRSLRSVQSLHKLELIMDRMRSMDQKTANTFVESISEIKTLHSLVLHHSYIDTYRQQQRSESSHYPYSIMPYQNIFKTVNHIINLDLSQYNCSFVPVLNSLKYLEELVSLKISLDLSNDAQEMQKYTEKQVQNALENLENIQYLSLVLTKCEDNVDEKLALQVSASIANLHATTRLAIIFQKQYYNMDNKALLEIQNSFIQNVAALKNTLNHFEIQQQFNPDYYLYSILDQIRNLYSVKIRVQIFLSLQNPETLLQKKYVTQMKKYPRLVSNIVQIRL